MFGKLALFGFAGWAGTQVRRCAAGGVARPARPGPRPPLTAPAPSQTRTHPTAPTP
jgi:hypothetical protein